MIRTMALLTMGFLLGVLIAAGSLAYECDFGRDVANVDVGPLYEADLRQDLDSEKCWIGGDHGYPTRMWTLEEDEYGPFYMEWKDQRNVDLALSQVLNGHDNGYNLVAFCDGVDIG